MLRMVQMRLQAISRIAQHVNARTGLVRWLSLKNKGLPAPTDHTQRFIELSPSRKVSIMDAVPLTLSFNMKLFVLGLDLSLSLSLSLSLVSCIH
jgi:hypothetical protein